MDASGIQKGENTQNTQNTMTNDLQEIPEDIQSDTSCESSKSLELPDGEELEQLCKTLQATLLAGAVLSAEYKGDETKFSEEIERDVVSNKLRGDRGSEGQDPPEPPQRN